MARRIVIIQGHPDPTGTRLCHALAKAYAAGAEEAGHDVQQIDVAQLDFPILRTQADFEESSPVAAIKAAQETIARAEHLVVIYPLWLGTMPALLKAFLEQVLRPGFAFEVERGYRFTKKLKGRSARIVVTMGMPALAYRWYFRAHSLKNLKRNILGFCGIGPCQETLIGMVETADRSQHEKWLGRLESYGRRGA